MKVRKLWAIAACLATVAGATFLFGAGQNEANESKAALEQQLKETLKTPRNRPNELWRQWRPPSRRTR